MNANVLFSSSFPFLTGNSLSDHSVSLFLVVPTRTESLQIVSSARVTSAGSLSSRCAQSDLNTSVETDLGFTITQHPNGRLQEIQLTYYVSSLPISFPHGVIGEFQTLVAGFGVSGGRLRADSVPH